MSNPTKHPQHPPGLMFHVEQDHLGWWVKDRLHTGPGPSIIAGPLKDEAEARAIAAALKGAA